MSVQVVIEKVPVFRCPDRVLHCFYGLNKREISVLVLVAKNKHLQNTQTLEYFVLGSLIIKKLSCVTLGNCGPRLLTPWFGIVACHLVKKFLTFLKLGS
jgi:hypothetical protein